MNTDGLEKGYIKIFRKIRKSLVWPNKKELSLCEVWIDILMEVQYSEIPKPVLIGLRPVIQNQGECLYSVATWADRWNMTRSKANRVLTLFQDCDMIRTKSEHITTRLTVCNYEDYADWSPNSEQQAEQEVNSKRTRLKKVKKLIRVIKEILQPHQNSLMLSLFTLKILRISIQFTRERDQKVMHSWHMSLGAMVSLKNIKKSRGCLCNGFSIQQDHMMIQISQTLLMN